MVKFERQLTPADDDHGLGRHHVLTQEVREIFESQNRRSVVSPGLSAELWSTVAESLLVVLHDNLCFRVREGGRVFKSPHIKLRSYHLEVYFWHVWVLD